MTDRALVEESKLEPSSIPYALHEFFAAVGRLKELRRQGWLDRGLTDVESVADHSLRCAFMAWMLGARAGLDTARLVKLLLVHDLPEALVGDTTPYAGLITDQSPASDVVHRWRDLLSEEEIVMAKTVKHNGEAAAAESIGALLGPGLGEELLELWRDYAERRSAEARFAAQIDKLEALLQAVEYRDRGQNADVENFLTSARQAVEHPVLLTFLAELEARISHGSGETTDTGSS